MLSEKKLFSESLGLIRKHDVSEKGSVYVLRLRKETPNLLVPLERVDTNNW
jgi:hypothetical protein